MAKPARPTAPAQAGPMAPRPHPKHARVSWLLFGVFFAASVLAWIAAYYAQESLHDQALVNVLAVAFMISCGLALLVLFARDELSRCPACKGWMRNRGKLGAGDTRIFTCRRCGVDWDARIRASDWGGS